MKITESKLRHLIRESLGGNKTEAWLRFMSGELWMETLTPEDLKTMGYKPYKSYVRVSPPARFPSEDYADESLMNIDFSHNDSPGTKEEFVQFMAANAGKGMLNKRAPRKYTHLDFVT